jgi:hypothetical protein
MQLTTKTTKKAFKNVPTQTTLRLASKIVTEDVRRKKSIHKNNKILNDFFYQEKLCSG